VPLLRERSSATLTTQTCSTIIRYAILRFTINKKTNRNNHNNDAEVLVFPSVFLPLGGPWLVMKIGSRQKQRTEEGIPERAPIPQHRDTTISHPERGRGIPKTIAHIAPLMRERSFGDFDDTELLNYNQVYFIRLIINGG